MIQILLPIALFTCLILYWKNNKSVFSKAVFWEEYKFPLRWLAFFFCNLILISFCGLCGHCYNVCISVSVSGVIIGAILYLVHLSKQTIETFKKKEYNFLPVFFSLPYFTLMDQVFVAIINSDFAALHTKEGNIVIALLYPFFSTMIEIKKSLHGKKA